MLPSRRIKPAVKLQASGTNETIYLRLFHQLKAIYGYCYLNCPPPLLTLQKRSEIPVTLVCKKDRHRK